MQNTLKLVKSDKINKYKNLAYYVLLDSVSSWWASLTDQVMVNASNSDHALFFKDPLAQSNTQRFISALLKSFVISTKRLLNGSLEEIV